MMLQSIPQTSFKIIKSRVLELTEQQIIKLKLMTLPAEESDNSYMRDTLNNEIVCCACYVAIAYDEDQELGWSLIRPYYGRKLIQVFVKPEFRRMKIGTKLVHSLNEGDNCTVRSWNTRSQQFFNTIVYNTSNIEHSYCP